MKNTLTILFTLISLDFNLISECVYFSWVASMHNDLSSLAAFSGSEKGV